MKQNLIIFFRLVVVTSASLGLFSYFNPLNFFSKGKKEMLVDLCAIVFSLSVVACFVLYKSIETKRHPTVESITPTKESLDQSNQFFFSPLGEKDEGVRGLFEFDLKENEPDTTEERLLTSGRT